MIKIFNYKRIILGVSFVLLFIVTPNVSEAGVIVKPSLKIGSAGINNGIVAHWTFDGPNMTNNVEDVSSNSNTGYLSGQSSTSTVPGKLGQALDFDGVDDGINAGSDSSIDDISVISVSVWFKRDDPNSVSLLVGKPGLNGWEFRLRNSGGGFSPSKIDFAKKWTNAFIVWAGSTDIDNTEDWYHAVVIYDRSSASNDPIIYLNGVKETIAEQTTPSGSATSDASYDLIIGGSDYHDGLLDDIRIYNRALSDNEVQKLYNKGQSKGVKTSQRTGDGLENGLVAHYTFDGPNMTSNVEDVSSNSNTGYLTNFNSTTTVPGKLGQALDFDGVDDYVNAGSDSSIDDISQLSVSFWAGRDITSNSQSLIRKTTGWAMEFRRSGGSSGPNKLRFFRNWSGATGGNAVWHGSTDFTDTDRLYHIVVTYDNTSTTNDPKIYVDGIEESITEITTPSGSLDSDAAADLIIGGDTGQYHDSLLDDVRIYNRILNPDEVVRLYNKGASKRSVTSTKSFTDSLVAHYTFDGPNMTSNVEDVSTNSNTGYLINMSPTTTVPGKLGQALEFDGTSDYMNAGSDSSIDDITVKTVSFWTKRSVLNVTGGAVNKIGGNAGWTVGIKSSGAGIGPNKLFYGHWRSGFAQWYGSTSFDNTEDWYHVVVIYDNSSSTDPPLMYVNGVAESVSVQTAPSGSSLSEASNSLLVGGLAASDWYPGTLDDIRIYNRALSADEIMKLYNAGR